MTMWAFLEGHVADEYTMASDHFSPVSSHRTDDTPESTEGLQNQLTQILPSINTLMLQSQDNTQTDITVFIQYLTQHLEYMPQ